MTLDQGSPLRRRRRSGSGRSRSDLHHLWSAQSNATNVQQRALWTEGLVSDEGFGSLRIPQLSRTGSGPGDPYRPGSGLWKDLTDVQQKQTSSWKEESPVVGGSADLPPPPLPRSGDLHQTSPGSWRAACERVGRFTRNVSVEQRGVPLSGLNK